MSRRESYHPLRRSLPAFLVFATLIWGQVCYAQILGAELRYQHLQQDTYRIHLTTWVTCGNEAAPEEQGAAVFEAINGLPKIDVALNLDSSKEVQYSIPGVCVSNDQRCYQQNEYSGDVVIMPVGGGSKIVWQKKEWGQYFDNLSMPYDPGIALVVFLPEFAVPDGNTSSRITSDPFFYACTTEPFQHPLQYGDDDGDSVLVSFEYTYGTRGSAPPSPEEMSKDVGGMYPTTPPPYSEIELAAGLTTDNPLPDNGLKWDPLVGNLTIEMKQIGNYLLSFTLNEFRNQKRISSVHRMINLRIDD